MIENRSGGTSSRSGTIRHRRRASLHLAIPWNGIANGAIQLFWLSWPALRTKRGLKTEYCSRFSLQVEYQLRSAAGKAVSQGFEFSFCLRLGIEVE